ncbi:patatin-like phospholipase domain-containing protein 4 isoform X2 [Rhinatrema bivittatum]|uniref:patatin-like phospholipase domain-containing protein 4 isoform X2 n=1 Tax=Rhinatrema bivittatum TaxID=194408 RepID=UPI00112941E7|nr:patatin-like phospholipase domain-containing protein 4 isoform X2 [Rhinatrema bivittatum]
MLFITRCCIRNTESVLGSGFHTSVAKIQFLSILQDKQTTIELLSDPSISTHLCNLHTTFNLHLFFISVQRMQPLNLSFAACGFLGIYHLGAAAAFLRHGKRMLQAVKAFAGASSGSLVATVLLTAPEKTKECQLFTYKFAEEVRNQTFGAATPGYDFMNSLRAGLESILPPNAHEVADNHLYVSITCTKNRENYLVSNFASREDLIKVLLASSFLPVYAGIKAMEYKGEKWIDGGLTNGLPILSPGRTVTVSPFSGQMDICPQERGLSKLHIKLAQQDITLSVANLERFIQALFPPRQEKMESLFQNGFDDAVQFLMKENWFEK